MSEKVNYIEALDGIDEVPTLPQVAFELMSLISDEKSSMRDIGNLIEDDPPLVAKILRIVNSGYYNLPNEITSIRQAVVMVGLEELRNLVFAMSIFGSFYHIKETTYFSFLGFWKHCAATGKVAVVLSNYLKLNSTHNAFISGLLHDFGRLILQLYFRDDYENVFAYSVENQVSLYEAEQKVIGFGHDEAGYWLACKWNLPEDLAAVMKTHHQVDIATIKDNPLNAIVHVADRITNIWGVGIEPAPVFDLLEDNEVWCSLTREFPALLDFPLEEMTRVFDMHLEEAEQFVEKLSEYQQLAEDAG